MNGIERQAITNGSHLFENRDLCVHELVERQVELNPTKLAVIFEEKALTYEQLNEKANQLAHFLIQKGLKLEEPVGVYMERSLDLVVVLLGILKAGGAYVPLDPSYPKARLEYMLEDSRPSFIISTKDKSQLIHGCSHEAQIVTLDECEELDRQVKVNPQSLVTQDHLMYIIYTSGSTGNPKGVMNTHVALNNRLQWMQKEFSLDERDRVLQKTPYSFDVSVWEFFWPLIAGATLVMAKPDGHKDPSYLMKTIGDYNITTIHFVPSMLQVFLDAWVMKKEDTSLKRVICSGEALTKSMERAFFSKMDKVELHNLYGPTEAAIDVSHWKCNGLADGDVVPIGYPISNIQLYIMDENQVLIEEPGINGELYIGGVGVAKGYYNKPDLTKEKFIKSPFEDEGQLYKTGDICRLRKDGGIEYIGRSDFQVKIRGVRIELGEIEAVIERIPYIKQCIVKPFYEEDHTYLTAYVTVAEGKDWDEEQVKQEIEQLLPEQMMPSFFIRLQDLPLSLNGKVNRKELPNPKTLRIVEKKEQPVTKLEKIVADFWKELLYLKEVGVREKFINIGGNSLFAVRFVARVKQDLNISITLEHVFEYPTIREISKFIEEQNAEMNLVELTKNSTPKSRMELSHSQKRLWFLNELEGLNPLYNLPNYIEIEGNLHVESLEKSLNDLIQSQDILRTNFFTENGVPYQTINPHTNCALHVMDLSAHGEEWGMIEAKKEMEYDSVIPFNLEMDPLYRFKLFKIDEQQYIFYFNINHIISDGWSHSVFKAELFKFYKRNITLENAHVEERVQYSDYIDWQKGLADSPGFKKQLNYWKEKLSAETPFIQLTADQGITSSNSHEGNVDSFRFPKELIARLEELCKEKGSTLFMAMLSLYKAFLYRLSGENDLAVGIPIAGRNHPKLEELIGFFVNTLVIRNKIDGEMSFEDVMQVVRKTSIEAFSNSDVPFEKIVEEIQPQRSLNQTPLFQYMFAFQDLASQLVEVSDLKISDPTLIHNGTAKFDLTLFIERDEKGYFGKWEYRTDIFDKETIVRFTSILLNLLSNITENSDLPIKNLSLLTKQEEEFLIKGLNDTKTTFPDVCLHELFEQQVECTPDYIAVKYEGEQLTYRELNEKANQMAHCLQQKGIVADAPVGLRIDRSLELVVAMLGILKAGGAYLPIDAELPANRVHSILNDANATLCLTQKSNANLESEGIEYVEFSLNEESLNKFPVTKPHVALSPDHLVSVYYTSGSTGKPKGVSSTHRGWVNRMNWMQNKHQLKEKEVVLQKTTLTFDDAAVEFFWPLMVGGVIALIPKDMHKDPNSILQCAIHYNVSVLQFVPSMLQMVVDLITPEQRKLLSNLRVVVSSGEALKTNLINEFYEKVPGNLFNSWGATEVSIDSTCFDCAPVNSQNAEICSVGKAIDNNRVYVLNRHLKPVPIGTVGDLYIAGIGLARGYLNNPKRTAEAFIPDPFYPGEAMYRTGDRGYLRADGNIMFVGREDNQIKLRGMRIELGEIENNLRMLDNIKEAVVLVKSTDTNMQHLVAYYTEGNEDKSANSIKRILQKNLPDYMVPSYYVKLEKFPLNANGKIDRKALPEPSKENLVINSQFIAPRNEVEQKMEEVWKLRLGLERVGTQDDFFELGGHSLLAVQIIADINREFNSNLQVKDLFKNSTIEKISQNVQPYFGVRRLGERIQKVDRTTDIPLSDAQKRIWFLNQLNHDAKYNMPLVLKFSGLVDEAKLNNSINQLINRHESLRTIFIEENGIPQQKVLSNLNITLQKEDLEGQDLQVVIQKELQNTFDLSKSPLIRGKLVRCAGEHILILTFHHIICDGWSLKILKEELLRIYMGKLELLEEPTQYPDYAVWQMKYKEEKEYQEQLLYWKKKLAGQIPLLQLPTDKQLKQSQQTNYTIHKVLEKDVSKRIKSFSKEQKITTFMNFLTTFNMLLSKLSEQKEIILGTPVVNRNLEELSSSVGLYLNTLPLKVELDNNEQYTSLLQKVKQVVMEAFSHQDVSFERIVEEIQPERNLSRNPLFDVLINYRNFEEEKTYRLANMEVKEVAVDSIESKFFMTLYIEETFDNFNISLAFQNNMFSIERMEELLNQYEYLLEQVLENPSNLVGDFSLITPHVEAVLPDPTVQLEEENFQTVIESVKYWASTQPNHVAVEEGETQYTYHHLQNRSLQIANAILEQNVGMEKVIGVYGERSFEMISSILGVLHVKNIFLNIDYQVPEQRMKRMLEISQTACIVATQPMQSEHEKIAENLGIPIIKTYLFPETNLVTNINLDTDLINKDAYIFFTSGTTGEPKGVLGTHNGLAQFLYWQRTQFEVTPMDRTGQLTHVAFDVYLRDVFLPLTSGATLCIPNKEEDNILKWLQEKEITLLHAVPSLSRNWLYGSVNTGCLNKLRHIFFAGEPLQSTLVQAWREITDAQINNFYGQTETTLAKCFYEVPMELTFDVVPIGKPIFNAQLLVVNERGKLCGVGEPGEIIVRTPYCTKGYINKNIEAFCKNEFTKQSEDKLYRTGDMGRFRPDGGIEIIGRNDGEVKIRGVRINKGEVAAVITKQMNVTQCLVVDVNKAGETRLDAYVVFKEKDKIDLNQLRRELMKELPLVMIPNKFIAIDKVPVTKNGKVDKKQLLRYVVKQKEQLEESEPSLIEKEIIKIWSELLPNKKINRNDNFFELGGHSLLIVKMISIVRECLNYEVSLRVVFENPTVQEMATYLLNSKKRKGIVMKKLDRVKQKVKE
ncbi:amino acid adenylation protein [Bacillus manliponensis]|uniref:Amino acid adenylation protein n=1 Tax=Bacillus manliponensis TaxID=574376 RepID=A0A073KG70_9BACI|nr:non-ribosomal peptide synthetase [Bacillus manliponensis]KEK21313.1 amino acid adenylation protein [Bacillus manliponensis]